MRFWLLSCKKNPTIDWLIFTDDDTTDFLFPQNVRVVSTTLPEVKAKAQKVFPFPISLETPYKLCDYKPAYGLIFSEYTQGYDLWGHCDMTDCIFGNLRHFLTDEFLSCADKILYLGHMTLYRNTPEVNNRIFVDPMGIENNAHTVFGTDSNFAFDELNARSINTIYQDRGWLIGGKNEMIRDIGPSKKAFVCGYPLCDSVYRSSWEKRVFEWNNGRLYECVAKAQDVKRIEIGYVHFQKRKIEYNENVGLHYYLFPNRIIAASVPLTPEIIRKASRNYYLYMPYYKLKLKGLMSRLSRYWKVFTTSK
jgi:hypothetical protein